MGFEGPRPRAGSSSRAKRRRSGAPHRATTLSCIMTRPPALLRELGETLHLSDRFGKTYQTGEAICRFSGRPRGRAPPRPWDRPGAQGRDAPEGVDALGDLARPGHSPPGFTRSAARMRGNRCPCPTPMPPPIRIRSGAGSGPGCGTAPPAHARPRPRPDRVRVSCSAGKPARAAIAGPGRQALDAVAVKGTGPGEACCPPPDRREDAPPRRGPGPGSNGPRPRSPTPIPVPTVT